MNPLYVAFSKFIEIPNNEWRFIRNELRYVTIEEGNMLLNQGDVCQHIYFCKRGLFRMYYTTTEGKVYHKAFITSHDFFNSYSSMILNIPSHLSIEAMEESEVIYFSKETFIKNIVDKFTQNFDEINI